ncbi:MAG: energy-coupling factor transporter transmembrane protein EcfT [Anaerolineae bacterium]|nr:energy-coupling factor transporter transmembrane protein EcfT [Anaerolineae bacterium]
MIDVRVWLLWALTALVAASSTRNPLYIVLLLLVVALVGVFWAPAHRRLPLAPLRFALVAVPLAAAFSGLTAHLGDTVLFCLPPWLPLLGGAVTLESLVAGTINGLTLTVIWGAFAVLNQVAAVHELVRLAPRAFRDAGLVLSIALTYLPQTSRSLARIREAQAVRGHRLRGPRDWLPILIPLLISGLERSTGLSEAMVARGYGAVSDRPQPLPARGLLALGLFLLLGGWMTWLFVPRWAAGALAAMIAGGGLVGAVVWWGGRSVQRTTYRVHRWGWRDVGVMLGCSLLLLLVLLPLGGQRTLAYNPYPLLAAPPFDPLVGLGLLGLLAPAAAAPGPRRPAA